VSTCPRCGERLRAFWDPSVAVQACVMCGYQDYGPPAVDYREKSRRQGELERQLPSAAATQVAENPPTSYGCRIGTHRRCTGRSARAPGRVNYWCPCECHHSR
jgi:Zn ribbon nucleic-acid-binding protein